jgi:hypothetical protein
MARFDFKRRRRRDQGEQRLGLVVPARGLIVYRDVSPMAGVKARREVFYDEIAEREYGDRKRGRAEILFLEDDDDAA